MGEVPTLTAVVQLPPPVITERCCGCGVGPDGAPWAEGCSAECMAPAVVTFGERREAVIDMQDGLILGGAVPPADADTAERRGAALLAAARYLRGTVSTAEAGGESGCVQVHPTVRVHYAAPHPPDCPKRHGADYCECDA